MCGNAVFGDLLHLAGADLQLDALLARPDHRRMNRTVIVLLRRGDVVLEASRNDRPRGVHDAERLIALGNIADDDPEAENIRKLLEADGLALHLAPNRISALAPARDLGGDTAVAELFGELLFNFGDPAARCRGECFQPLAEHLVGVRIEFAERQILELVAHLLHAHAAGERSVDFKRLVGGAAPRLGRLVRQRAHIMQAIGELDQQNPNIVGDCQEELAQILGLLGLFGHEFEPLQLGQAFDQEPNLVTEHTVDLCPGGVGVLDRVVQERRRNRGVVELEIGEDRGDFEGMRNVRVAGCPLLPAMRAHGIDISPVEKLFVGLRVVLLDLVDQLVLTRLARLAGLWRRRFAVKRHQIRSARRRHPGAGLVLHPRQIDRQARHDDP